jgi:hypothetical protein
MKVYDDADLKVAQTYRRWSATTGNSSVVLRACSVDAIPRVPVQRNSGRRMILTEDPTTRWCECGGEFKPPMLVPIFWDNKWGRERGRRQKQRRWMRRGGLLSLYRGGRGRWNLHHMSLLPLAAATLRFYFGGTMGRWPPPFSACGTPIMGRDMVAHYG